MAIFVAALTLSGVGGGPQERSGGSSVPCAVPLAWRVARVDPEFGLDARQATAAVLGAAEMWEHGSSRALFRHDPDDGFPIRFVYDERQARTAERSRLQADLAEERSRLDASGEQLKEAGDRHAAARARFAERQSAHEQRVEAHNADVRGWNERGGAPADVAPGLEAATQALREAGVALESERRSLEADLRRLQEAVADLNRANAEHARRAAALAREFPPVTVEAGEYREAVRTEGGRPPAVGREIRVYRFGDVDELRLIVAHELGHALGLGHSDEPRAVMSAAHDSSVEGEATTAVHAADLALLRARCPRLPVASR